MGLDPAPRSRSFGESYKRVFLSGLATMLPTVLTIWVLTSFYSFVDRNAAEPLSSFLKQRVLLESEVGQRFSVWLWDLPLELPAPAARMAERSAAELAEDERRRSALERAIERRFPVWFGFVLAGFGIFVVGFFIASFVGRALWRAVEGWLQRLPIIKSVYPSAKQMVEFVLSSDDSKGQFDEVVALEYPRAGQWTIGFVTGGGRRELSEALNGEQLTIFIPFAPTPISGFVVFARREDLVAIDMSVDEAFKFYISAGVIGSDSRVVSEALGRSEEGRPLGE
jgi:uncharacterized membrane protein